MANNPLSPDRGFQSPGMIDPNVQQPTNPMANYQFSPEELRVLSQCNRDSFYQRCLPFGTGLGVAAYLAVKNGYLKPSVKYGAAPKVVLGVIFGYMLGKASYQSTCAERIMRLPNSRLAEAIRQRKKGSFYESFTADQGLALAPFSSQTEAYSDDTFSRSNNSSLNMDTERPSISGLDDTYRPNLDVEGKHDDDLPLEPPKYTTTYDDLRLRNREEYNKKQQQPFYRPVAPSIDQESINRPLDQRENEPRGKPGPKNKYGDTWSA